MSLLLYIIIGCVVTYIGIVGSGGFSRFMAEANDPYEKVGLYIGTIFCVLAWPLIVAQCMYD